MLGLRHPHCLNHFFSFWSFCHFCPPVYTSAGGWLYFSSLNWERDALETFRACFLHRSLVLVATRGQPEGLRQFASHLVSLGFAKTADLSSKGSSLVWKMAACPAGSERSSSPCSSNSYCRVFGGLGLPGCFSVPCVGLTPNGAGRRQPGAAGALRAR